MDLTLATVVILVVVAAAAVFQSSIGFGANLIAQPIVYQIDPGLVPGPVLMTTVVLSMLVLTRDRQPVQVGPISSAVAGAILGIAIAVGVIGALSSEALAVLIALCVLVMVLIAAIGRAPQRSSRSLFVAGVVGGFGSTTAGIGGPPVALLFTDADGPETRSFLSGYFLVASTLTFAGLFLADRFGLDDAKAGVALLPAAAAGFVLSKPLLPIVDRGATRPAILAVSGGAALLLLARTILG